MTNRLSKKNTPTPPALQYSNGLVDRFPTVEADSAALKKAATAAATATADHVDDPIAAIFNLNDSSVRHKVRRRPRKIADIDREKRAAKTKASAVLAFKAGQDAAKRAIRDVLVKKHGIRDCAVA